MGRDAPRGIGTHPLALRIGADSSPLRNGAVPSTLRIDKALWYLRLASTRRAAQAMVAAGHIRLDGRRVERASTALHAGSLLVLPGPPRVRVLRIISLPTRRGPPGEAAACIEDMGLPEAKDA